MPFYHFLIAICVCALVDVVLIFFCFTQFVCFEKNKIYSSHSVCDSFSLSYTTSRIYDYVIILQNTRSEMIVIASVTLAINFRLIIKIVPKIINFLTR